MADNRECQTSGCGCDITPDVNGVKITWDCPECDWCLEIVKEEE